LIRPPSYCPNCYGYLKWYEKIPLISFVLLRGKCSHCKTIISIQYPLIELINGSLLLLIALYSTDIFQFIAYSFLAMTLLCLVAIDFKYYILPDKLIIISFIVALIYFGYIEKLNVLHRFYIAILAGSAMYFLRLVSSYLYKKETLGIGDVKLSFLIGFIVGTLDVFLAIFFGFLIALIMFILSFIARLQRRESYIPLGPYLVFGMSIYLIYNNSFY